jgi:anthranilate phosphoribosyltransferase
VIIADYLSTLLAGRDLSSQEATALMQSIVAGQVGPASIAAIAVALRMKGESVDELTAFATVMRAASLKVDAPPGTLDTCGTGGDGGGTFNISTAAALVAAGMGIPVAKHGGRSASSKTGSADVLMELGVNCDADAACIARCIQTAGIGFMFAQNHHPGMKHVAPVRRELGVRTVFNLLGPLSNPAHAPHQLLGVFDPNLCEKFAAVLRNLGSLSAMIVCGAGRGGVGHLDEISTYGPTKIAWLRKGQISMEQFDPTKWGVPVAAPTALDAADARASAAIIRAVLDGQRGAPRDSVVVNAAAAALVSGRVATWSSAIVEAEKSIDEGRAKAALQKLVHTSMHQ